MLVHHTEKGNYRPTFLSQDMINSHWFNHCWCVCQAGTEQGEEGGPNSRKPGIISNAKFPHWKSLKGLSYRIMFIHLLFSCRKQQNVLWTKWGIWIAKSGLQDYFTAYGKALQVWIWEVASIMRQGLDKANKSLQKWKHLPCDRSAAAYTAIGSLQSLCNRSWG